MSRILNAREAAAYCGLSLAGFRNWISRGIIPGRIKGTYKYDQKALDLAIDKASGIAILNVNSQLLNPYEKWKASQNENGARTRSHS